MPNLIQLTIAEFKNPTIINDTFMCYIMKKFPNLQNLELISDVDDFESILGSDTKTSVDVTVKFLDYLSRLQSCFVNSIETEEKATAIVKFFYPSTKEEESSKLEHPHVKYNNDDHIKFPIKI